MYTRRSGDKVSVFKLGMVHPLPVERLREFAAKVKRLYVIEELDGVIETPLQGKTASHVIGKELFPRLGEFSQKAIARLWAAVP